MSNYLMKTKGQDALGYYLQYLSLKEEITECTQRLEVYRAFPNDGMQNYIQSRLIDLVEKMQSQIKLLNLYGVTTEELLLLSMNVDPLQIELTGGKI